MPLTTPLARSLGETATALGEVVADACTRVYEVLDRFWRAREAVKDRWVARLHGPPVPVEPYAQTAFLAAALSGQARLKPSMPTYDGRDARAELAAVAAAGQEASRIATAAITRLLRPPKRPSVTRRALRRVRYCSRKGEDTKSPVGTTPL